MTILERKLLTCGMALVAAIAPIAVFPADADITNAPATIAVPVAAVAIPDVRVRLKDIVRIQGLGERELIGYGVVVGLNGSGDKDIELTKRTMANILQNFNISLPPTDIKSKNVAAVVVTARAPAFHRQGDRLDVQVSSIGDALSLEGGILLMTPLLDSDGALYAIAQGGLTIGGYSTGIGGVGGQTQTKNYTTVGRIPDGAVLRQGGDTEFARGGTIKLVLRHPDFTTANRLTEAINHKFTNSAAAADAGTVSVRIPDSILDANQAASFVAGLETIRVVPDAPSKIVVNERTGTIVMGGQVRISEAVVAHGNLTVKIGRTLTAYMPQPFTAAGPVLTEKVQTETTEDQARIMLMPGTATVNDLADLVNQLGATPRDLISILAALQSLGAIQMEIVTM